MANSEYIKYLKEYMSNRLSAADKKKLLSHIANDKNLDEQRKAEMQHMPDDIDRDVSLEMWRNINKQIQSPKRTFKPRISFLLRAAAILILPILASWLTYTFVRSDMSVVAEMPPAVLHVPNGQMVSMVLPDSTLVWINSASTLTYHNKFGLSDRTVELSGEAYFEVAKNKKIPFVVKTSEFDIKVTGTSFNVKAYPGDNLNTVTLISGSIDLITVEETFSLQANQQLVYNKKEKRVNNREIPRAELFSDWKSNSIRYENEQMEHVGKDIERLFNVKITYNNERIKYYLFTGTIHNVSLVDFLETICRVAPFRYEISQGNIIIHEDQTRAEYYIDVP